MSLQISTSRSTFNSLPAKRQVLIIEAVSKSIASIDYAQISVNFKTFKDRALQISNIFFFLLFNRNNKKHLQSKTLSELLNLKSRTLSISKYFFYRACCFSLPRSPQNCEEEKCIFKLCPEQEITIRKPSCSKIQIFFIQTISESKSLNSAWNRN